MRSKWRTSYFIEQIKIRFWYIYLRIFSLRHNEAFLFPSESFIKRIFPSRLDMKIIRENFLAKRCLCLLVCVNVRKLRLVVTPGGKLAHLGANSGVSASGQFLGRRALKMLLRHKYLGERHPIYIKIQIPSAKIFLSRRWIKVRIKYFWNERELIILQANRVFTQGVNQALKQ